MLASYDDTYSSVPSVGGVLGLEYFVLSLIFMYSYNYRYRPSQIHAGFTLVIVTILFIRYHYTLNSTCVGKAASWKQKNFYRRAWFSYMLYFRYLKYSIHMRFCYPHIAMFNSR